MEFSKKLIKLRKSRGLSQEDLANEINVTRQTISKWELGTTIPDMEKLKLISNYFEVSVDELISDTKSGENQYVNNKEFIGVDEKYIPKQNLNDDNKSYVNKNKKSNKIFLIYLVPICFFVIIFVFVISMFFYGYKSFKEFHTEFDSNTQEFENIQNEMMNEQKEKMDSTRQEFENIQKEMMNEQKEKIDSTRQEFENFKNSVYNQIN